jgi:HSP20 family protein
VSLLETFGKRWIISGVRSINCLKTFTVSRQSPAEPGRSVKGSQWTFSPAVETVWGETALNLRVIIPGVTQNDLKVSVQNNQLVVEGQRKQAEAFTKNTYTQLAYGKFYIAVTLPSGLDLDKLNCRLHDGVLDIQIPVSEQMKPRQTQIQTGEGRKGITA